MKKLILLSLVVAVALSVAACFSNGDDYYEDAHPGIVVEEEVPESLVGGTPDQPSRERMLANRIDHVGDASGVGRLLSFLPVFDENFTQNMVSLHTESEPYGLILYFEPNPQHWNGENMAASPEIQTYSDYLFESIGNLGYITFKYRMSPSVSGAALEVDEYTELITITRD